jgi:hypothetical protein
MAESYVKRVFNNIQHPELRKRIKRDTQGKEHVNAVGWIEEDLDKFPGKVLNYIFGPDPSNGSLQQSDLLRNFYLTIAVFGLRFAYNHQIFGPGDLPGPEPPNRSLNAGKKVIIVGAGISGLAAGYELKREGYDVEILEMSQRYGGRLKTLDYRDGFDRGLHTDGEQIKHY